MKCVKMMQKLLLLLSFALLAINGYGQQSTIRARIVDDEGPLIGVSVVVKGSTNGTATDPDGVFQLQAEPNETLTISYIGYKTIEMPVRNALKTPVIQMTSLSRELDEVVVVGYGVQKKVSSVASITTTKGEDLLKGGNVNTVSEALQGKLNGVVAVNSTGKPGDNAASIFIRGKASWNNTDPLVLVDGIQRNMNDVDINEIESVSVLKDASATAVYGVRGANGVILVTTKRGSDQKPKISFSANFGFKQPTATLEWADYVTSMKMFNEAAANDKQWDKQIPQSTISAWENAYATGNYGPYNDIFPQVDWYDAMMRSVGISQNYNVNVRGGTDKMSYFASVGYQYDGDNYKIEKQKDFDPRNNFRRYNWRSNFDFKLTKATLFSVNIAGKIGYRNETAGDENFTKILQSPSNTFPIKYSDGYWGDAEAMGYNIVSNVNTRGQNMYKSFQGWYDVTLKQDLSFLTKGLSVKGKLAYNQSMDTRSSIIAGGIHGNNGFEAQSSIIRFYRKYDYANPITNPDGSVTYPMIQEIRHPNNQASENLPVQASYDNLSGAGRRLYYEFAVEYNRRFGDHQVSALALLNRQIIDNKVGDKNTMEFSAYTEDWVGRVTYNWKERYLAEVNMAYTGSEKFAPGQRFGFFPSFSVGWRISEESFIKKLTGEYLSNLKMRYSYGKVGSDAGAPRFNYMQIYNQGGNILLGNSQNVGFGPTYSEGTTANPSSTWEVAIKQNLGLEIGLWNKLSLNLDFFNENRTGILMTPRTTAAWFGAALPSVNIGEIKNHGLEVELGWNDKIGSDVHYRANFNLACSENRIVFRDDPRDLAQHLKDAGKPIGWQSRYLATGNFGSIDDIFNYAQTGISGASTSGVIPGDLIYIDYNGDGVIDSNDQVAVSQMDYPLTTLALNLGVEYKGFGISALLYAPLGVYKLQFDQFLWDFPMSNIKAQPNTLDRWTPDKSNSTGIIRPSTHLVRNHNATESTYRYTNYSYLRLKNVEVSYKLPKRLLSTINISDCQFYVTGSNLLTISGVDSRVDPETGGPGSYPIVRTYTVGARLSF